MAPKSMKSRRRKNLYKDFQKVKLKAGKTLPKGLNVTDASFKSRQIHLKEQLVRDVSSEPKSHRQLSITTLLSQLEHYNMNIRRDAVLGLHQILQSAITTPPSVTPPTGTKSANHSVVTTPPVLHQHLGPLVSRSAALVVDRETTVRQAALKLFQILLTVVPETQMTPFFKLVTAHLCCAMTHIEEQIQADSLKFVDLLVEKYPGLVAESSAELLPNFISLIARRAQGQTVKSTLAINPGLKVHARKWRTSVLDRLYRVLNAVHEYCDVSDGGGDVTESANQSPGCGDVIHVDGINAVYCVIRDPRVESDFKFSRDQTSNHGNVLAHAHSLHEFASGLVPLIVQSWAECTGALANNTDIDDTLLPTMAAVVKVTALLCRCIQGKDAVSMETKTGLVQQLFSMFPHEIEERKKKKSDKTEKISMTTLNLTICEILCHLTSRDDVTWSTLDERMTSYLTRIMNVKLQPVDVVTLTSVIRLGLQNGSREVQKFMLSLLCGIYRRGQFATSQRQSLHDIMINFVIPRHDLISEPCIQDWLQSLPQLLLRTAHEALVRRSAAVAPLLYIMATLAPRKYELFSKSLDENIDGILDLVISTPLAPPDQRRFVELLYHVTSLHRDVIGKLYRFCCLATTDGDVVNYLLNVIYSRLSRDPDYCPVADYLSLVMSLICVDSEDAGHCDRLSQIAADKLHLFPNTRQIFQLFLLFIKHRQPETLLSKIRVLNLVMGLVRRVERKKITSIKKENSKEHLESMMDTSELPCEGLCKDSLEDAFGLVNEELVTVMDLMEDVTWEEDGKEEESKELLKERTLTLLEYRDVYTAYIDRLERQMDEDVGRTLRSLHDVVRPVTLKRNARRSEDRIRDLLKKSETSEDHHVTIRRQIEYELSLAAS